MPKSKEISSDLRERIVACHEANEGYGTISKRLQVPIPTIQSLLKKFKEFGTTENLKRTGRPCKISPRYARGIVRKAQIDPKITSKQLQEDLEEAGVTVSRRTVRRTLNKACLKSCRPRRTPMLKKRHVQARLKFAKTHLKTEEGHYESSFNAIILNLGL